MTLKCDVCESSFVSENEGWCTRHENEEGHSIFCSNECEARFAFPVRSKEALLCLANACMQKNPSYEKEEVPGLLYEGYDLINRDERESLEKSLN